jgi:hypothetical protein
MMPWTLLWGLGVLCLLLLANFWLTPWGVLGLRRLAGGEMQVDLRLYYRPDDISRLFLLYGAIGRARFRRMLLLDMVFPAAYGAFVVGLVVTSAAGPWEWAVGGVAILAALLDYGENVCLLAVLRRWPEVDAPTARWAARFTSAKVLAILTTVTSLAILKI